MIHRGLQKNAIYIQIECIEQLEFPSFRRLVFSILIDTCWTKKINHMLMDCSFGQYIRYFWRKALCLPNYRLLGLYAQPLNDLIRMSTFLTWHTFRRFKRIKNVYTYHLDGKVWRRKMWKQIFFFWWWLIMRCRVRPSTEFDMKSVKIWFSYIINNYVVSVCFSCAHNNGRIF